MTEDDIDGQGHHLLDFSRRHDDFIFELSGEQESMSVEERQYQCRYLTSCCEEDNHDRKIKTS